MTVFSRRTTGQERAGTGQRIGPELRSLYARPVAFEIRPLDFGDKIGATFKLYQSNFTTLITIVAVVVIPLQLLSALVGWLFASDLPIDPETGVVDVEALDTSLILGFIFPW